VKYTKEQLKEWEYPEYDPNYDNPEWLKEQWRKEDEDPRLNPNFFLDQKDPEYWHNVARRPYAKALIQTEEHWSGRKNLWLQQFDNVREANLFREQVAEELEGCAVETKRLVQPIMKYRIVEVFLMHVLKESVEQDTPFSMLLEREDNFRSLCQYRDKIDLEGDKGAEELFQAWETRNLQQALEEQKNEDKKLKDKGGETLNNPEELVERLVFGEKCKKDGVLEWEKGNHKEALASWRQGHEALWRIKAPEHDKEAVKTLGEIHIALLKNLAQAAIKLGYYNEALNASDMAIRIDGDDHKAWFRKACALEGLGRLKEIEACLEQIDSVAVGRPDRERIEKDTRTKREKVRELLDRDDASSKRMLQRGVQKALFSDSRDTSAKVVKGPAGPPPIAHQVEVVNIDEEKRKKLTKDGAEDLLKDLSEAYQDATFRKQISKLGRDVTDQGEFIVYLNKVALPYQKPVLEKWGFEPSGKGVMEMSRAIQDHTRGKAADPKLRVQAEETMRALYGEFYDVARGAGLRPEDRAKKPERNGNKDGDSENEEHEEEAPVQHWTGRSLGLQEQQWEMERKKKEKEDKLKAAMNPGPVSAKERKEIWSLMAEAMNGKDKVALRKVILRAMGAGFSAVTIRSAKKKLAALGGSIEDDDDE